MVLLADVPAIYSTVRENVGGVHVQLRFDLAGCKIVGVHISPSVQLKEEQKTLWQTLDSLLPGSH